MNFSDLARKAAKGSGPLSYGAAVHPEDLIRFSLAYGADGADEIERLCKQHGWHEDGLLADGTRVAPLARWAAACIAYGRGGAASLRHLLADRTIATFAIAVLSEVRTESSVTVLLDYCTSTTALSDEPDDPFWRALGALNGLMSFDDGLVPSQEQQKKLQYLVIRTFSNARTAYQQTLCLCALRGAPIEGSLEWAKAQAVTDPGAMRAKSAAIKSLRHRLSEAYMPPSAEEKRQIRRQRALNA
ncbi:hypothetical protein [Variovorax paradoxus]|uniref:hypothetical protein n=1 Tax=Variovorax paradoxus TaxID=34073 RepID=UPI002784FF2E|nr:hypothetical protein [Variovorax paradoxus]MDP9932865.1 hypothetical protein [Variovorax paradoxus]